MSRGHGGEKVSGTNGTAVYAAMTCVMAVFSSRYSWSRQVEIGLHLSMMERRGVFRLINELT